MQGDGKYARGLTDKMRTSYSSFSTAWIGKVAHEVLTLLTPFEEVTEFGQESLNETYMVL